MHVLVPCKYICETIVQMKCTYAKFGNTELRSRPIKAVSVVHTHMVHRYLQVESTKRYSPYRIQYVLYVHQLGNPMVCTSCISDCSRLSVITWRCKFGSLSFPRLSKTLSFCIPHFLISPTLFTQYVSLEIQTCFLPRFSAKSFSTYVCTYVTASHPFFTCSLIHTYIRICVFIHTECKELSFVYIE